MTITETDADQNKDRTGFPEIGLSKTEKIIKNMGKRILIVDDSAYMRSIIRSALTKEGFEVVGEAGDGETAIDLTLDLSPDLITLDNILPDMMGLDILGIIHERQLPTKVVMVSVVGQQTMVNKGIEMGAAAYLLKPFTPEILLETINKAL